MVRRQLGRTAFRISPIALGTTKFGRNTGVKYPSFFELPSDQQLVELFKRARELGVNLIDTAPAYGECEQRIGPFTEKQRDEFVLCTKCGERYSNGRSTYDFSSRAIVASVEQSLRGLRTDHIDILLLHSDGNDLEILTKTDAVEILSRLKKDGKIRAAGISAKTAEGILEAARSLDVVMAPFNQKETGLAEALAQAYAGGLGVLAIKGLFSGHLDARPAIEFVLRQAFIDALVIGTIDPAHLREAVAIADHIRGAR
jgi:aryl-alcohol dehydrogenase-like predicted oxidoreductase